jgi:hypothetical protein
MVTEITGDGGGGFGVVGVALPPPQPISIGRRIRRKPNPTNGAVLFIGTPLLERPILASRGVRFLLETALRRNEDLCGKYTPTRSGSGT